uniref:Zinc finger protein 420-like n=1 Tax=Geotrypetes seraphini TaxID=260995 RepID=A0A6P8SHH6_GEOSA|nr:zinc finger protein 420-like [Geotrypetes seraphini]XP_033818069.1 zinc finger protein 420-like [Geotrypetes seraphini]
MDLDSQEQESQGVEVRLDYRLAVGKRTVPVPESLKVKPDVDMTAKVTADSKTRMHMVAVPEKLNGIPTQTRYMTFGGVSQNWGAKKSGLEHIGVLSCPANCARKQPAESPDTPAQRRKVNISKYDQDRDATKGTVIGKTQNVEVTRWSGQVRTPMWRCLPQKTNSRALPPSVRLGLEAKAGAINGPPPISRHPALLKTFNGYSAASQSALFVEGGGQQSEPRNSALSVGSPFHRAEGKLAVQNAKKIWVSAGEAYQSFQVNRQTLLLKDGMVRSSHGHSSEMPQENKSARSRGIVKSESTSNLSFISQKTGGIQPTKLYKEKSQQDSGDEGEIGIVENAGLTAQTPVIPECGEQSGKFLLIDSKGLPYTVFVRQSKPLDRKELESGTEVGSHLMETRVAPRKLYSCPVCSRVFAYLSYLQRHSITHSEQKPHVCQVCGKAFKRTSHLERHKYTHAGSKPHRCPICQRSFRDAGELTHHQRVHTGERPYQCAVCHMRFGERNTLQRHVRRKHLEAPVSPTEESAPLHPVDL